MNKLEALKAAREYVAELYAVKNDRGYPRFSGNVNGVLTEELRVAAYLASEHESMHVNADFYRPDGTFSHDKQFEIGEYVNLPTSEGGQVRFVITPRPA